MQIEVAMIARKWSATIRETTERDRITSFSLGDQIANPPERVDLDRGIDFGEALAQSVNVNFDRVRPDLL